MKKRDLSLDVMRIVAIFMIVVFHFASVWGVSNSIFLFYANGTWGSLGTSLFLILSGYLLRKRYTSIDSVKSFYFKRWLSIYPSFYIAFAVAFLINVIRIKKVFYQGPAYTLIYSLFGIDNYLNWFDISTYAIVGEWFSTVIVVLYILFPFLNKVMSRFKWTASVIFTIFYIIYIYYGLFPKHAEISFVSCGFIFWVGMLLAEYEKSIRKHYYTGIITLLFSAFFLAFNITLNIPEIFKTHLLSILIYVSFLTLLKNLSGEGKAGKIISYFSEISYAVYLVHHYIINNISSLRFRFPDLNAISGFTVFILYLIFTIVSAAVLEYITQKLITGFLKR